MSKIRKIVTATALASSLCVAALPLASYADVNCTAGVDCQESDTLNVDVNVSSVISLRLVSYSDLTEMTLTCDSTQITESSDGCSGDEQKTLTALLPNDTNITDNTSSAYTNAYVSTNDPNGYVLTLIDTDENVDMVNATGQTIGAVNSKPVVSTNPGWAVSINGAGWQIMKHNKNSAGTITAETPITVSSYNPSASGVVTSLVQDHQSVVYYGYATSASQATGTYTDKILYTATAQ